MRHLAILQQLLAFDSAIYSARQTSRQRILLLTSESIGHCLLERAIAIAKRKIDHLGNACESTLISRVRNELVLNNGSLIQYADERPVHNRQKYHVVFWQPPAQRLAVELSQSKIMPASVLAPGGSIVRLNEAIAQFYARHRAKEAR